MGPRIKARTFAIGAVWTALTALCCLAFAAAGDAPTLSLSELMTQPESLLMSCESSSSGSSAEALLWCSDPNSPQCIPAAPTAPHIEIADRPDAALFGASALPAATYVLLAWPDVDRDRDRGTRPSHRVERPPRG